MNEGFEKITIEPVPIADPNSKQGASTKLKKGFRHWFLRGFFVLILFLLVSSFALFFPVRGVYTEILKTQQVSEKVMQAVKNQNIEEAKVALAEAKTQLEVTRKKYASLLVLGYIPAIGNYYKDGFAILDAGYAGVEAGEIAINSLIPYADLLGLKGESTFVSGSADERIQTAVQTLDKLTPSLGSISEKLAIVQINLNKIDPNRYPEKFQGRDIRSQLVSVKTTIDEASSLFVNARPLMENLPSILGQPDPKRYLILFQNDKELRPTGGFITAYAIFKLDKGKVIVENSDDIYKLDERNNTNKTPPQPIIKHLKVFKLHLRDTNYDPDYIDSIKRFEEMYNSISGTTKVDGIIAVDTHVLVEAMKILGSIPAYGTNFTVDNDPRCDCPQVIYELEEYAGKRVNYIREDRKDIIGVLLYQIMQKALGVAPGQYWGQLFQMVLAEFDQKHILIYLKNDPAQASLEALNWAGRINLDSSQDYLHINDANLGGAKSNLFVKHTITQNYEKGTDGRVTKTVTVDYKNPAAGSPGCNLEAGGLCLNGPMPNWVRIYVPKGSELIDFSGSEDEVVVGDSYNKTYFEAFITVDPSSVAKITVKYKLPKEISSSKINLLMQKQAGTEGHDITIMVGGKEKEIFKLTTDKKIEIKI